MVRDNLLSAALLPLGQVELRKDRLIVFPNCHVHKLSIEDKPLDEATNESEPPQSKRAKGELPNTIRLLYFHLVNPEERILSTRDDAGIDSQELRGTWWHQDWNVREMQLYTD